MPPSSAHRLLVVEDEPALAEGMRHMLTRLGYEVSAVVDTGEEAVRQTFALMPDLVLMDIGLRGPMEGTEAARQIRVTTGKPVIFVSGRSDPLTLKKARECEPHGYILKPVGERELLVQVELALHRHKMECQRATARREMEAAYENLKALRGLLPVCAGCKKIQESDGRWTGLEDFLIAHANVELTHGFCPDCEKRLYGTTSRAPFPHVSTVSRLHTQTPASLPEDSKKPAAGRPRVKKREKGS